MMGATKTSQSLRTRNNQIVFAGVQFYVPEEDANHY
jgi:hypothetical protein